MTTVQVNVDADRVLVDLKIDMTRAAGGSLDYYRLSRIAGPLTDAETRALLERLAAAVSLKLGDDAVPLRVVAAELPTASKEVFLDPLSWPMTHVVLEGRLPASARGAPHRLQAVFQPGFHFEEPIALTFMQMAEGRRMTRWLVTSQVSPPFELRTGAAGTGAMTGTPAAVSLAQFVRFGFLHILPKGLDHVLFVIGLYLGARSLRSLLILITCFTLAHSITLGLSSIGIIRLSPNIVEPLISASIVWVAVENFFPGRTERYRPLLVFGFGLLHGLGFASALSALDAPQGSFLPSLLSFNVGIELGQVTVIAGALCMTAWCRQRSGYRRAVALPASALIALVAAVWTVQRLW
ncbi:MAG: rane protein [Gammaproteobacteria bacterium]|nr:rane protein [Gammaproteobacteria bacterium]